MLETNIASLEHRLTALASTPAVAAALERQAKEAVAAHRAAIARLRAAQQRFLEAELANDAAATLSEAEEEEIRRAEEALHKLREKRQAKIAQAELAHRAAQNEVRAAITAIRELPPWRSFEEWRAKIEQTIAHAWVRPIPEHNRPFTAFLSGDISAIERKRLQGEAERQGRIRAHSDAADDALIAFREVLNSARMTYATEPDALEGARAALDAVKELYSLPSEMSWPS